MDKHQLIKTLSLQPHIEGGYFRRTYCSTFKTDVPYDAKPRHWLSSIFYMLTDDSPIGRLHRNRSDIVHYFQAGSPLTYWIVHPDGRLERVVMGPELERGQQLQLTVLGGCWKASELEQGEYGLVSEAVSPGFEYGDMELANEALIKSLFPQWWDRLAKFVGASPVG